MNLNNTQKALLRFARCELTDQEDEMAKAEKVKDLNVYMTARARAEALRRVVELYDRK